MITHAEIIDLIRRGIYKVDLDTGIVSKRNGKPLYVEPAGRTKQYPRVRLCSGGRRRKLPVAHVVWLAGSGTSIPEGFEIHHRDTNVDHNWWSNLFCLFDLDHRKLHNGKPDLLEEETPF